MSVANCPSCGGPIEFAIGSSAVVVCSYCRSVVARTDRGYEAHGIVAALIDTASPLRVGLAGKFRGVGFRITGRSQLGHQAGGLWNEWYAAFDDGRWGWLAEAQGRFYVTFKVAAEAPPRSALELGQIIDGLTVAEIGRAHFLSAEGELPWRPVPGSEYDYADLTGTEQRFATIDYSEEPPVVFKGHEVSLSDLGLEDLTPRAERVTATTLNCTQCGGPLDLRMPEQTERIFCPNCGSGHDLTQGKLQYLGVTKKKKKVVPVIPLGSKGTIDDVEYVVAGFMERAVHFDIDYFWTEYLLFNREKGFRWLVHSDDHWSFVTPLRPGEVGDWSTANGVSKSVHYNGKRYRLFQDATAKVTYVLGEFYWKVAVGEKVDTADYIAPPFGISKEVTRTGAQEINYSHARYLTPQEVADAFGIERPRRPKAIGPMQPFPGPHLGGPFVILLLLLLAAAIGIRMIKPSKVLLDRTFDLATVPANSLFTDPIEVSGTANILIEGSANVDNDWLYVEGDFVNILTNSLTEFSMPIEYYHGVDQGERWSEGTRFKNVHISRPEKGQYVVRLAAQWQEGKAPQSFRLRVVEGVFRWSHFILAFLALIAPLFLALFRLIRWEMNRWKESSHSPYASLTSDDDDE